MRVWLLDEMGSDYVLDEMRSQIMHDLYDGSWACLPKLSWDASGMNCLLESPNELNLNCACFPRSIARSGALLC